jgi:hypothetical protein
MQKSALNEIFELYVRYTPYEAIVYGAKAKIGRLSKDAMAILQCKNSEIYVTTRCLKHIYDKRPAEEFDFIMAHLQDILERPHAIYLNKDRKRGNFCFEGQTNGRMYLAAVEVTICEDGTDEPQIATAFRIRDDQYLKNYELLWGWRDGAPHRHTAFPNERANDAPQ